MQLFGLCFTVNEILKILFWPKIYEKILNLSLLPLLETWCSTDTTVSTVSIGCIRRDVNARVAGNDEFPYSQNCKCLKHIAMSSICVSKDIQFKKPPMRVLRSHLKSVKFQKGITFKTC